MNQVHPKTSQGVRDLNGPAMRGFGYNGSRKASCMHRPGITPTYEAIEVRYVSNIPNDVRTVNVRVALCRSCDGKLYDLP